MFQVQEKDHFIGSKNESKKKKVTFSNSPLKMVYDKNLGRMVSAENSNAQHNREIKGSKTISPELAAHFLANPHLLK